MRAGSIGGLIVILWLILGGVAAYERGYFKDDGDASCAKAGTILVTVAAGPLNWLGVNPKITCDVPEPASSSAEPGGGPAAALSTLTRMGLFTVAEARAELARLRPVLTEIVTVRADAAELAAVLASGAPSGLGGLPEWKAASARLDDLMTEVQQTGAELKGLAPLLVDFPADLNGEPVLLCWLENDPALTWYHRRDLGFAGRRRIP